MKVPGFAGGLLPHGYLNMKKLLCGFILFLLISAESQATECPTDALLKVTCDNASAISHIKKKHCKDPGKAPEQFEEYYCENLVAACLAATESPDAKYPNNCYKQGEDSEIVGYLSDGQPTNCYQANFESTGMGTMVLKTMYPAKDMYCTQHNLQEKK